MKFNRKKFFDDFRRRIDPTISQEQVDGLEFILGEMENDPFWKFIPQIAYALATIFHETAGSFQPVEEGYYLEPKTKVKPFQKKLRYYPWFGRGYVQLTWEKNYERAKKELGVDFIKDPAAVMEPKNAYRIMTLGMHQGWFTGKKLDDYIKGGKKDYVNARRIINGTDKAGLIAGYARSFENILVSAATQTEPVQLVEVDSSDTPKTSPITPSDAPPPNRTEPISLEIENKPSTDIMPSVDTPEPEPYRGVGFWASIKKDLIAFTGGNVGFGTLNEYATQASGWPEWVVGLVSKLAIAALVITVAYFIFRVVHYVVDRWQQNQRVKLLAEINSDPMRNDIRFKGK